MALWYRQRQNRETTFGAVNYVSILYLGTDFTFLTENDKIIVICSDGVWEFLSNEDI